MGDEDTAERRALLKKVGPIFLAVIDGGGDRDVLSEKPCVLGASGTVCRRLINPVLLRENGGKKSWRDHRMERVEPRQGI